MDAKELPARPNLERYKKLAKDFVKAFRSGEPDAVERVKQHLPKLSETFRLADSQFLMARWHGFESWPKFRKHIEAVRRANSPVLKFEAAVDAIVTGDIRKLRKLLRENPELIRTRSTRAHGATLLHYVSANGVEDYRQKTPRNAVAIADLLVQAGADVNAVVEAYGRGTTLGLVATSVHPKVAGVQIALLETLLGAGAGINGAPGGWNPLISALHNGRGEAAQFLAQRGAHLDLEGAAGVGWLEVVKSFFDAAGNLKAGATKKQMESGFMWACEYSRNSVVTFLLDHGVDVNAQANTGLTGLHWAVVGGQVETIQLLLKRGAGLETRNVYGGTVLDQAIWCCYNGDPTIDYPPILKMLVAAGAKTDVYPKMKSHLDDLMKQKPKAKTEQGLKLRIVLMAPPAGVDFGLQKGRGSQYETVQKQRSTGKDLSFEFVATLKPVSKKLQPDFLGPFVQGPPDERFVYIDIGTYAGQADTAWSRRLKIPLRGISPDLLLRRPIDCGGVLEARVPGTGKDGGPNCATVKPFDGWKLVSG